VEYAAADALTHERPHQSWSTRAANSSAKEDTIVLWPEIYNSSGIGANHAKRNNSITINYLRFLK
jgi:hypothetical protein